MNTTANPARFTDLVITGSVAEIAALTGLAREAGALVYRSAPQPAGPGDPRLRVLIRLNLHHR